MHQFRVTVREVLKNIDIDKLLRDDDGQLVRRDPNQKKRNVTTI